MHLGRSLRQAARLALAACLACAGCSNDCSGSCETAGGPINVRLEVDEYIEGLDKPWDIAWLPNGTLLLSERTGQLKVFIDGVGEPPSVIPIADVVARGEGGLMGLEVDPDFASNGWKAHDTHHPRALPDLSESAPATKGSSPGCKECKNPLKAKPECPACNKEATQTSAVQPCCKNQSQKTAPTQTP